jgi:hypothetical protein
MNWRNPEDYKHLASLDLGAWAWEFLRRNPGYREAWAWWKLDDLIDTANPVSTLAGSQDISAIQDNRNRRLALATKDAGKWGLLYPLSPNDDAVTVAARGEPRWRRDTSPWEPIILHDNTALNEYRQTFDLSPHVQFVALHFERPLQKQIRQLEELVKRYRDNHALSSTADPMSHPDKWPLYLRAIDAKDAGATYGQMASCFFENSTKVGKTRDTLKQARAVRDGGYRKIAMRAFSEPD